jgi:hypothetical protein
MDNITRLEAELVAADEAEAAAWNRMDKCCKVVKANIADAIDAHEAAYQRLLKAKDAVAAAKNTSSWQSVRNLLATPPRAP